MAKVIEQRPQLAEDYLEIKYEALITEPKKTLKQACQFIGIAFHEDMLSLAKPADEAPLRPGITGQTTNIIPGNTNKYLAEFSPNTIRRIEELTTPLAAQFGYLALTKEADYKPLGILEVLCVVVSDRYSKLRYFIKRWGWRKGLLFAWQRFVSGTYRNV